MTLIGSFVVYPWRDIPLFSPTGERGPRIMVMRPVQLPTDQFSNYLLMGAPLSFEAEWVPLNRYAFGWDGACVYIYCKDDDQRVLKVLSRLALASALIDLIVKFTRGRQ